MGNYFEKLDLKNLAGITRSTQGAAKPSFLDLPPREDLVPSHESPELRWNHEENLPGTAPDLAQGHPDFDPENPWHRVFATREGKVGGTTATEHVIKEKDTFVALPSRAALNRKVEVFYQGKTVSGPVLDVGPWNTNDPYWLTNSRPQAESGRNVSGKRTNIAGIDLSNEFTRRLGLNDNDWVYWRFSE